MTKTNNKLFGKNLRQLETEFPNEILPPEKLPLIGREEEFSKIPLEDFNAEHLRFMIQQGFGWKLLIPIALGVLAENPFADGDRYDGSLLSCVLTVKQAFWQENPDLYRKAEEVLQKAENVKTEASEEILTIMLPQKIYDFRKNKPQTDE